MALARWSKRPVVIPGTDEGQAFQVAPQLLEACRSFSVKINGPERSSIGITSTLRGEGKTTIAMALALIQANDYRRRVILLDADLDSPSLAERIGARPWPGLAELAYRQATITQALQPAGERISVIAAGEPAWSSSRLAMHVIGSGVLGEIARHADVVVADLPPLLSCSFGPVMARAFLQPSVLVIRAGLTPLPQVRQAIENLPGEPAILLNGTHSNLPRWLRLIAGR
jgi:Mrp family chromosome partitioning ATPase